MEFLFELLPAWVWLLAFAGFIIMVATSRIMEGMRYELRDDALCIVAAGTVMRRVPYSNIESAHREFVWLSERWRRKTTDPNLTLRLREGLFICMVINPPNAKEFLAELQGRLRQENEPGV